MGPQRGLRAAVVIAGAAVVLVAAGVAFMNPARVSQPGTTFAAASPPPILQHAAVGCLEPALVLTGVFNECTGVVEGMACPSGSMDATRVIHLRGVSGDFILYVEVDGGYHGPGTYTLARWPHESLNAGDGLAKVALREWNGGRMWLSSSGSLTINVPEENGTVDADLTLRREAGSEDIIHIKGPWLCP